MSTFSAISSTTLEGSGAVSGSTSHITSNLVEERLERIGVDPVGTPASSIIRDTVIRSGWVSVCNIVDSVS